MPLNDRQIKHSKPKDKPYKLTDGNGLYLHITPAGGKLWKLDYAIDGKRKTLSIGKYPHLSLVEAREAAENARKMKAQGIDPSQAKQQAKAERQAALLNTFEHIARDWHQNNISRWKPNHAQRIMRYLEKDVFPYIGSHPIQELRVAHIKQVLDAITARGVAETAEKIRQWINKIFNYALMLERVDGNPASALVGYIQPQTTEHMPALPREELTEFYRRLLQVDAEPQNRLCLMLLVLCFPRNTEIRGGEWKEINWQTKTWTIPASRMKRPREHLIPLSDWAMELLQELHQLTGKGRFMFPNRNTISGYISENTLGNILNRIGYKGIATPHGFRSLASSILNEQGFNPDAIERQLAHVEENKVRAAYNRAEYVDERREMMQWYSDFLRGHYHQALALIEAGQKAV